MSKLEELKNEAIGLIEGAWHALEGSSDVEAARELVGKFVADAEAKARDIAEHIFYHVVGNAEPAVATSETAAPTATAPTVVAATIVDGTSVAMETPFIVGAPAEASNPSVPGQPNAAPIDEMAPPATEAAGPAGSAPDGSVQVPSEPATGMAPPAGEPVVGSVETVEDSAADTAPEAPSA